MKRSVQALFFVFLISLILSLLLLGILDTVSPARGYVVLISIMNIIGAIASMLIASGVDTDDA
jgi:hypothetical protein